MSFLSNRNVLNLHCYQVLFRFCLSLIGLYTTYIVLTAFMDNGPIDMLPCQILAGFVHYFVLATAAWTVMESINVCLMFQNKLDGVGAGFITIASIFAWGMY